MRYEHNDDSWIQYLKKKQKEMEHRGVLVVGNDLKGRKEI